MTCNTLDAARSDTDYWLAVLRRTGRKLLDPEYISNILSAQERERAMLAEVDLGESPHFLLLSLGVHRVWTIGLTVRHAPFSDGMPRNKTYAIFEWESERSLHGNAPAPCAGWKIILPQHLLDAVVHPLAPADARLALVRYAPNAADTIDIDGLDALGFLRVFDHLMRSAAEPGDALALRRAYRHALEMRNRVRMCFSRRADLWSGEPVCDIWA